jgi:hypothetical protein
MEPRRWLPALAAPSALVAHIVSESLASGESVSRVAAEPSHLGLLALSLLLLPLWFAAARMRALGLVLFAFVAASLVFEGNGLGAGAMLAALLYATIASWLAAHAIGAFTASGDNRHPSHCYADVVRRHVAAGRTLSGPYFAYVPVFGNRPPPGFL